jgi:hypothetical protein
MENAVLDGEKGPLCGHDLETVAWSEWRHHMATFQEL